MGRRKKSVTTTKTEPKEDDTTPLSNFKPDDLVWIKMPKYPWWPARVYPESEATPDVLEEKREGCLLVNFLESNQFAWTKQAKPFRGPCYEEYIKPSRTTKKWTEALSLIHQFEKGEYTPPAYDAMSDDDDDDDDEDVESPPSPTVSGKKRKRSTSTKKETKEKAPGKQKKKSNQEPPEKKARAGRPRAAPKSPRKTKITQVKMSNEAIRTISDKLGTLIKEEQNDKIQTLLEILSKIEVSDATLFKEIPIIDHLQTLLNIHTTKNIKQLASKIWKSYGTMVKDHQDQNSPKTDDEPKPTSSSPTVDEKESKTDDTDATKDDTAVPDVTAATDEPVAEESKVEETETPKPAESEPDKAPEEEKQPTETVEEPAKSEEKPTDVVEEPTKPETEDSTEPADGSNVVDGDQKMTDSIIENETKPTEAAASTVNEEMSDAAGAPQVEAEEKKPQEAPSTTKESNEESMKDVTEGLLNDIIAPDNSAPKAEDEIMQDVHPEPGPETSSAPAPASTETVATDSAK